MIAAEAAPTIRTVLRRIGFYPMTRCSSSRLVRPAFIFSIPSDNRLSGLLMSAALFRSSKLGVSSMA